MKNLLVVSTFLASISFPIVYAANDNYDNEVEIEFKKLITSLCDRPDSERMYNGKLRTGYVLNTNTAFGKSKLNIECDGREVKKITATGPWNSAELFFSIN